MLFNLCVVVILVANTALIYKITRPQEEKPKIIQFKKKKPKPSKEVERATKILNNIDRYDGTGEGQQDVK